MVLWHIKDKNVQIFFYKLKVHYFVRTAVPCNTFCTSVPKWAEKEARIYPITLLGHLFWCPNIRINFWSNWLKAGLAGHLRQVEDLDYVGHCIWWYWKMLKLYQHSFNVSSYFAIGKSSHLTRNVDKSIFVEKLYSIWNYSNIQYT
jgi:hypothetical protein